MNVLSPLVVRFFSAVVDGGGGGGRAGCCFQTSRAAERRERSAVSKTRTALPNGYGNKVWHPSYLSASETPFDPRVLKKILLRAKIEPHD